MQTPSQPSFDFYVICEVVFFFFLAIKSKYRFREHLKYKSEKNAFKYKYMKKAKITITPQSKNIWRTVFPLIFLRGYCYKAEIILDIYNYIVHYSFKYLPPFSELICKHYF